MLIKCSECEAMISDKAYSCPHCGAPNRKAGIPGGCGCMPSCLTRLVRVMASAVIFLSILALALFVLLKFNLFGANVKLRELAEADAAGGSAIDRSEARVMVKHRILQLLDWMDGRTPAATPPVSVPSVQEPAADLPGDKVERKPLELPPEPPEKNMESVN